MNSPRRLLQERQRFFNRICSSASECAWRLIFSRPNMLFRVRTWATRFHNFPIILKQIDRMGRSSWAFAKSLSEQFAYQSLCWETVCDFAKALLLCKGPLALQSPFGFAKPEGLCKGPLLVTNNHGEEKS